MQQHTGQHILSAAFDRLFASRTVSFHLGAEACTIDLAEPVPAADVERAVDEANRVVWEDRPVTVRFASADEAGRPGCARSRSARASCGWSRSRTSTCRPAAARTWRAPARSA